MKLNIQRTAHTNREWDTSVRPFGARNAKRMDGTPPQSVIIAGIGFVGVLGTGPKITELISEYATTEDYRTPGRRRGRGAQAHHPKTA